MEGAPLAEGDAPRPRAHLVDRDRERLAGPRAAHLDRAAQRVPAVQLAVSLEELDVRVPVPARVERLEAHGVAGVEREDRRERRGEVAVHGLLLERELVDHARGS